MTCKDCIYYEVCKFSRGVMPLSDHFVYEHNNIEDLCEYANDRSRFVELPYSLKFGDKIYYILKNLSEIDLKNYSFTAGNYAVCNIPDTVIDVSTKGFFTNGLHDRNENYLTPDDCEFIPWDEIGKTVFLTRKEAEQALKERENNETNTL